MYVDVFVSKQKTDADHDCTYLTLFSQSDAYHLILHREELDRDLYCETRGRSG